MRLHLRGLIAALVLFIAGISPAIAQANSGGYLQCAPFAREYSGIQLFGRAADWWGQAQGRYARGNAPKVGAVLSFQATGRMRAGHVATVSDIVDARTIRVTHANWSIINGRRGQIEQNVSVVDVSANNDWSEVRVWYAPIGKVGTSVYPANGFIYNEAPRVQVASAY